MSRLPTIIPTEVIERIAIDERESRIEQTAVAVLAALEGADPWEEPGSQQFARRLKHAFDVAEAFEIARALRREAKRGGR